MAEKFIVIWTIDGETMSVPHSTQDGALQHPALELHSSSISVRIEMQRREHTVAAGLALLQTVPLHSKEFDPVRYYCCL
jgi:hypothetical protein